MKSATTSRRISAGERLAGRKGSLAIQYATGNGAVIRRARALEGCLQLVYSLRGGVSAGWLRWPAMVQALRPHQWIKNALLFVPLVLSHGLTNVGALADVLFGFVAFSLCASAVYVLNDVLDLESDCHDRARCRRPFASGALPLVASPGLIIVPLAAGLGVSCAALPWRFSALLATYLLVTTLYSVWLKRKILIDVFTLAGLYTIRVLAGGVAGGVEVSEWLLAFSMFLFTSLAFAKRHVELIRLNTDGSPGNARRGYIASDLSLIESMGCASGYLAVLVLALYIHSPEVKLLYKSRFVLWLICPLILYWVSRIWFQAKRRHLVDDPVVYAVTDWASLTTAAATAVLLLLAR